MNIEELDHPCNHTCSGWKQGKEKGYKQGYTEAVMDFGIWKDGQQTIGCLDTPVKEILDKKFGDD